MATVMCKCRAFKVTPNKTAMCKYSQLSKGTSTAPVKPEVGGDAIAQLLCVARLVFPTFNVLKVVHDCPFAFSDMSVMPYSLRNILLDDPTNVLPRLDQKVSLRLSEYDDVIRGLLFSLPSLPPTLIHQCLVWYAIAVDTFAQCQQKNSAIQAGIAAIEAEVATC